MLLASIDERTDLNLLADPPDDDRPDEIVLTAIKRGHSHEPEAGNQVQYQRCGGGRRVIRKPIKN